MSNERRRSLYDPVFGLDRTHMFPVGTINIATGVVFPVRTKTVTVSCLVKITNATPAGVVFEVGSATTGLAIWIAAADRKLMAAVGDAAADTGVTLTGSVCRSGQILRIGLSCIPSVGKARLWINGRLIAYGVSTTFPLPNGWSDAGEGAVGDVDTAVTTRVAVGDRIALTGAAVVGPVGVYVNQRPRQFFEVA